MVSGASGTVGRALVSSLEEAGHTCIPYDRAEAGVSDYVRMNDYLQRVKPDAFYHLAVASKATGLDNESWIVNYEWPSELAWICRQLDIPFVFTSSVTVFNEDHNGPFTIATPTDEKHGYGFEKRKAEERVFYQNPSARIVRLGWQIGDAPGSNNMIDFLEKEQQTKGLILASKGWLPSCSFLQDTATALGSFLDRPAGLYQINGNFGWSFYEIALALKKHFGFTQWCIEPGQGMNWDQRMLDERPGIPPLSKHLKDLRKITDFHHVSNGA